MHRIIYRFHKHILVLTVLITIISIILTTRLTLDLNFFSLLPPYNNEVRTFFDITDQIGSQSLLIALVEIPPHYDRIASDMFVDILASNFSQSPLIIDVEYRSKRNDFSSIFQTFMEYFPLFLRTEELEQLALKLSDKEIDKQVIENKKLLTTPFGVAAKEIVYSDPLGLRKLIKVPTGNHIPKHRNGYYRTDDGKFYFVFMKPEKPPQDITFSKKLMTEAQRIERISLARLSEQFNDLPGNITVSYTGGYPIAVHDEATTKRDIKVTLFTSFATVLLLFWLSFRTIRVLIYVGISLVISLTWTLGFACIVFHHLNILTCIFSCVLIGLGIDFAIHIVNRYFSDDKIDLTISDRLHHTFREAGMGIIIGGITTAAAFYSIAVSDFRGFQELGIVTGTGILLCLVVMLFVLPCLLVYFSYENGSKRTITIREFGVHVWITSLLKYPGTLLTIIILCVFASAILGMGIHFDDNLRNFRPADSIPFYLQNKVTQWLGGSTGEAFLVVREKSEADAIEKTSSIYDAMEKLKESGMIAGIKSISQYFLSPSQQKKNIEYIRHHPDIFTIQRIKNSFYAALAKNGFEKLDHYDRYFENLANTFSPEKILLPSSLNSEKFGKLSNLLIFKKDDAYNTITYIAPLKDLWSRADTTGFKTMIVEKLKDEGITDDHYIITGPSLLTGELKKLIIQNLHAALWLACLSIAGILIVYYRNLKFFILSILPLMIGSSVLIGIMVIFRIDFNFFNIIVLPMIVGIGIDDGVHLTNTFRQTHHGDLVEGITKTGRAVVLTSLTTIAGFGSISLAHYPGLQSMGYVAVIGIAACLIASVVALPVVFNLIGPKS
ncbi:MAG: MMPL family transporter [Deltaproteobacteria bacterium]|nr:MMPL family transporter [Deltaproteobacteria bacterium]